MGQWEMVRLGEVVKLQWRGETPEPDKTYRLAGVRLWGNGAYVREEITGDGTKYPQLFRIEEGDIIVNKIWARNGSVSVARGDVVGSYGSPEFPTYQPDRRRLLPEYAFWLTKTPFLWSQCAELSRGTSSQSRLKPERFLNVVLPLPPLAEQRRIVERLDTVAAGVQRQQQAAVRAQAETAALLAAAFAKITTSAPRVPMGDIAPLVRRPVTVEPDEVYPELGVRSFGKGTFHKPPLNGIEVGSKKLFWIEPDDLLFNIVFAWEGAVAIAQPQDSGRCGSHRFLTCVADKARATNLFLHYYFLSPEGLAQLGVASPGGAGRNRTLGLKALERISIPLPSLDAQRWFNRLQTEAAGAARHHTAASNDLNTLLPALLGEVFGDKP